VLESVNSQGRFLKIQSTFGQSKIYVKQKTFFVIFDFNFLLLKIRFRVRATTAMRGSNQLGVTFVIFFYVVFDVIVIVIVSGGFRLGPGEAQVPSFGPVPPVFGHP